VYVDDKAYFLKCSTPSFTVTILLIPSLILIHVTNGYVLSNPFPNLFAAPSSGKAITTFSFECFFFNSSKKIGIPLVKHGIIVSPK
jgi:hypothetical protein